MIIAIHSLAEAQLKIKRYDTYKLEAILIYKRLRIKLTFYNDFTIIHDWFEISDNIYDNLLDELNMICSSIVATA